ncbi:fibulin-1-like [Chironomus tepperi]|uniref:fibulin-1-like n=1 Tax=Chironomus tepperi TaxID=113505 RepID=UPI00391FBE28
MLQVMEFHLFITIFTILTISFPVSSSTADDTCNDYCPQWEVYSRCAGPQQPNCWNRNVTIDESQCIPGCVCTRGMIRHPNTFACISVQKCPTKPKNPKTCPSNEVYSDCMAGCQKTCDTLDVAYKCRCVPGCVCCDGYVRSQITGKCIPVKDCKKCPFGYTRNHDTGKCEFKCNKCPKNEEYNECGTYCEQKCFGPKVQCIQLCKKGCFCKKGFVRGPDGRCIPIDSCPKCPANETYECGNPLCEKTCDNYKQNCTIQPIRCEDKCYCNNGLVRNSKGVCVPIDKCNVN